MLPKRYLGYPLQGGDSYIWKGTSKCNLQLVENIRRRAINYYILHYSDLDDRERLTMLTKLNHLPFLLDVELLILLSL